MGQAFLMGQSGGKKGLYFEDAILDVVVADPDAGDSVWRQYGFVWRQYESFKWLSSFVEQYTGHQVMVILNWNQWGKNSSMAGMMFYENFGPDAVITMAWSGGSNNDDNWGSLGVQSLVSGTYTYSGKTYNVYDTNLMSNYRQSWSPIRIIVW